MARVKISEFRAKRLVSDFLNLPYNGISIDTQDEFYTDLLSEMGEGRYVLKVDQAVKQRKKKGLVSLDVNKGNVKEEIERLKNEGYRYFILEEFLEHEESSEYYLAIQRVREGKLVHYSTSGGIEIEENKESIKEILPKVWSDNETIARELNLTPEFIDNLLVCFDNYYFSFLEINPIVVKDNIVSFLDMAVEVDSAAEFFVSGAWGKMDVREGSKKQKTFEEVEIQKLKEKSPASFSFEVLNPNGSLFLLLSGGGASLVTADEVYQQGKGEQLANYGEYSGSPTEEETYIYTKNLLSTLLKSESDKKAIILSGGVANFTDVRITFKGIIRALSEVSSDLKEKNVKVFVRRGGPHQEEGLSMMKKFLEENELLGEIHGPELTLTDIVKPAINYIL